jgi:hypothetical protein
MLNICGICCKKSQIYFEMKENFLSRIRRYVLQLVLSPCLPAFREQLFYLQSVL